MLLPVTLSSIKKSVHARRSPCLAAPPVPRHGGTTCSEGVSALKWTVKAGDSAFRSRRGFDPCPEFPWTWRRPRNAKVGGPKAPHNLLST